MKAFVLMPFSVDFQPVYERLIRPALEKAGFEVSRADSVLDQRNILNDIVEGIHSADLVVADLTGLNPNVLYELGICHGLNIPTVLLTQYVDEVPFDLRAYRLRVYTTSFHEAGELSAHLERVAGQHRRGEITFGSPVSDYLRRPPSRNTRAETEPGDSEPGREAIAVGVARSGRDDSEVRSEATSEQLEVNSHDFDQELGWLDLISERDEVLEELTATYSLMAESISEMGGRMNEHSEQISDLTANKVPGAAGAANKVASVAARDMRKHAQDLQDLLPVLEPKSERLIELLTDPRVLKLGRDRKNKEDRQATTEILQNLLEANQGSLASVRTFRSSIQGLRDQGISRETNRAAATLRLSLDRVINSMEVVESGLVRVLGLLESNGD